MGKFKTFISDNTHTINDTLFLIEHYTGDTGLRGPNGEVGIPGTKGDKGDQGD